MVRMNGMIIQEQDVLGSDGIRLQLLIALGLDIIGIVILLIGKSRRREPYITQSWLAITLCFQFATAMIILLGLIINPAQIYPIADISLIIGNFCSGLVIVFYYLCVGIVHTLAKIVNGKE